MQHTLYRTGDEQSGMGARVHGGALGAHGAGGGVHVRGGRGRLGVRAARRLARRARARRRRRATRLLRRHQIPWHEHSERLPAREGFVPAHLDRAIDRNNGSKRPGTTLHHQQHGYSGNSIESRPRKGTQG